MNFLSAYYFRAHTYTLVPRHVREDMEWMRDCGTDAVCVGVLEQDLYAAVENIERICEEANRVGMQVWAVPSRWGGLVAGCPKVPSYFTATHPETWMLQPNGAPYYNGVHGPMSSVHHPATREFFLRSLDKMLRLWPIRGIVWDEPKAFGIKDVSPAAQAALGDTENVNRHVDAMADFFGDVSAHAKQTAPDTRVALFLYANLQGYVLERTAKVPAIDDFGCDGRPWRAEDGGKDDGASKHAAHKVLLDLSLDFKKTAEANGKRSLILIENHAIQNEDIPLLDRRLPEVLQLGFGHVLYYYYPRSLKDPDAVMNVMAKHLKAARK